MIVITLIIMTPISIKWYYDYQIKNLTDKSSTPITVPDSEIDDFEKEQDEMNTVETFIERFNEEYLGIEITGKDKGK